MAETKRVAVVGAGVAGLSAAWHLAELWKARHAGRADAPNLEITLIGQLVPHEGSVGSGLAGKAMSRSFAGRTDPSSGYDRQMFYGPMMPEAGCIPHGYHILWEYPNLRRMLGDTGDGMLPADGDPDKPLRQVLRPPGGAQFLGAFQGLLDDPAPGGPGVACLGLVDVERREARTEAAQALLRLDAHPVVGVVVRALRGLFRELFDDVADPLEFADMFYTREFDVEMRLTLIAATLQARVLNPETATVKVDGVERKLTDVEYDVWAEWMMKEWADKLGVRKGRLTGWAALWRRWRKLRALFALAEGWLESNDGPGGLGRAFPVLRDLRLVYHETERVVRAMPDAIARLLGGKYPAWRSVHFRFAPDATFASPYSFDAATALRSLAFCYWNPRSARMWSVDGQRFQQLWILFWRRLQRLCDGDLVTLVPHGGRVHAFGEDDTGAWLTWGGVLGHGGAPLGGPLTDLWMPHIPNVGPTFPPPAGEIRVERLDAILPTFSALLMAEVIDPGHAEAREDLRGIANAGNETLELLLWIREPIPWGKVAREALSKGAIGGLEGPFCMVADYSCGLWAPETFAAEDPFGDGAPFAGSMIEACGGYSDVFACATRDDAYGWPLGVKEKLRELLSDKAYFARTDDRPWPGDEGKWREKRADGTWKDEHAHAQRFFDNWIVASRWLVWGYLRQLSLVQSLGLDATRALRDLAARLDPRENDPLDPAHHAALEKDVRYVVMRNTTPRNRFWNPGVGDWSKRPVSGAPLRGTARLFPAGEWTRNGLDIVCMEAACLSGMRAARGAFVLAAGGPPPASPAPKQVVPDACWYDGVDPWKRTTP
ncbi:MAG: hypothetical protein ACOZNI_36980 [Myxococcota bacterium]